MYGAERLSRRDQWFKEASVRLDWIGQLCDPKSILEVGAGTGEFLKVSSDAGIQSFGVEPSAWAAEQARTLGADVQHGFLTDWRASHSNRFVDLVAMWHVLEHVPDPAGLITEAASVIRPGGLLVLEVPNFASSEAARLGTKWPGAQVDDHWWQFHPDGMRSLLERTGLRVAQLSEISREPYEPPETWNGERERARTNGRSWPPLDLLRAAAVVGHAM